MEKFRSYIRKARILSGLSQKDVANMLGYTSPQFISNWERGLALPPLKCIRKLIRFYKLDVERVIKLLMDIKEDNIRSVLCKKRKRRSYEKRDNVSLGKEKKKHMR